MTKIINVLHTCSAKADGFPQLDVEDEIDIVAAQIETVGFYKHLYVVTVHDTKKHPHKEQSQ